MKASLVYFFVGGHAHECLHGTLDKSIQLFHKTGSVTPPPEVPNITRSIHFMLMLETSGTTGILLLVLEDKVDLVLSELTMFLK